jgi:hypothetical protein
MMRLYRGLLACFGAAESRCAWCGRLLGWHRNTDGHVSHGMCAACSVDFERGAA